MVEVFKTNVHDTVSAMHILDALHARHLLYVANFDLEDHDRILRVKCLVGEVDPADVFEILHSFGFLAEVLSDEIPQFSVDLLK